MRPNVQAGVVLSYRVNDERYSTNMGAMSEEVTFSEARPAAPTRVHASPVTHRPVRLDPACWLVLAGASLMEAPTMRLSRKLKIDASSNTTWYGDLPRLLAGHLRPAR